MTIYPFLCYNNITTIITERSDIINYDKAPQQPSKMTVEQLTQKLEPLKNKAPEIEQKHWTSLINFLHENGLGDVYAEELKRW